MLKRAQWLDLARKVDWDFSYVREQDVFPGIPSGEPWLPHAEWADWDEPFRTSFAEYVTQQHAKDASVYAVRDAVGNLEDIRRLDRGWVNALKLHAATLPLAEFAAVVGNLRAARFARRRPLSCPVTIAATRMPRARPHNVTSKVLVICWARLLP